MAQARHDAFLRGYLQAAKGVSAGKLPATVAPQVQAVMQASQGMPSAGHPGDNLAPIMKQINNEDTQNRRYHTLPSAGKMPDAMPELLKAFVQTSQGMPSAGKMQDTTPDALQAFIQASQGMPSAGGGQNTKSQVRDAKFQQFVDAASKNPAPSHTTTQRGTPPQDSSLNDPILQKQTQNLAQTQQQGTQIFFVNNAFNGGEISPIMMGRYDQQGYVAGCQCLRNLVAMPQGGITKRPGLEYIGDSETGSKLIPFVFSTGDSLILEFRPTSDVSSTLFVWFKDGTWYDTGVSVTYNAKRLREMSWVQSADVIYFAHEDVVPFKIMRYGNRDWRMSAINWKPNIAKPSGIQLSAGGDLGQNQEQAGEYWYDYVVTAINADGEEGEASDWTESNHIKTYKVSGNWRITIKWDVVAGAKQYKIYRKENGVFGFIGLVEYDSDETADTVADLRYQLNQKRTQRNEKRDEWQRLKSQYESQCVVTQTDPDTGEQTTTVAATTECSNLNNQVASAKAEYDALAAEASRLEEDLGNAQPHFEDDGIIPDTEDTPPRYDEPFVRIGDYPRCVFLHQQRLGWASTKNKPLTIWMSASGMYERMLYSVPPEDDDRIEVTLAAPQVNRILWCEPDRDGLLIGTEGNEWMLKPTEGKALTPADLMFEPQTNFGSANLGKAAIRCGGNTLFIQRGARVIRSFGYDFSSDRYTGADLTLLARHIFKNSKIVNWAWQAEPYNILWCVRNDGVLCGVTFMTDQKICAWHRHTTTGGKVKDVACIPGDDGEDQLWLHVARTDENNVEHWHIERMRPFHVDDASDANQYRDGKYLELVQGRCIPVLPEGNIQHGSSFLRVRKINAVKARIYNSTPFQCKFDDQGANRLLPMPIRSTEYTEDGNTSNWSEFKEQYQEGHYDWALPIAGGWDENSRVDMVFNNPGPATVLAIVTAVEVADMSGGQQ